MAGLITVRLSRSDAQPWGFRLQGGKDFGAPLLIQKSDTSHGLGCRTEESCRTADGVTMLTVGRLYSE
ncbi:LIM domain-binding protein 3 [Homalodisca vitripennis]|nr:LIM domain-binding protein 3 [Homalodisca vitripennis]